MVKRSELSKNSNNAEKYKEESKNAVLYTRN